MNPVALAKEYLDQRTSLDWENGSRFWICGIAGTCAFFWESLWEIFFCVLPVRERNTICLSANVQDICILIGWEEYNIAIIVLSAHSLPFDKKQYSNAMAGKK